MPVPPVDAHTERVVDAMLSILETGQLPSVAAYATVVVLKDKAGITYGKHQTTDHSGGLDAVCLRYVELGGTLADRIEPHLDALGRNETVRASEVLPRRARVVEENGAVHLSPSTAQALLPKWMVNLMFTLYLAARDDETMRKAQDQVFHERYWLPARSKAAEIWLALPLSHAVVYDTYIQSGPGVFAQIRNRFKESPPVRHPDANAAQRLDIEKAWTKAYVNAREDWLANFTNADAKKQALVRSTVYRPQAFKATIEAGNWGLKTPFRFWKVQIPEALLA